MSILQACTRLLAIYLLSLATFMWLFYSPPGRAFAFDPVPTSVVDPIGGGGGTPEACPCQFGWFSTKDLFGAYECAHGAKYPGTGCTIPNPEPTDWTAWMLANCFELNGGVNQPIQNGQKCECFKCSPANGGGGCEPLIFDWLAFCSFTAQKNGTCDTKVSQNQYRRFALPMKTTNGGACAFTQGYEKKTECGSGAGRHWACKTGGCEIDLSKEPIVNPEWKPVLECKNGNYRDDFEEKNLPPIKEIFKEPTNVNEPTTGATVPATGP